MSKTLYCDGTLLKTDLSGRTAIVTGANSGIGEVTARQLAKQGATVVLACRDRMLAEAAILRIRREVPDASLETIPLTLSSLTSVRAFVAEFVQRHDELHLLVNNAGVMNTPQGKTEDGFEMQLGVNHLGHFLLTDLLLPTLKQSAPSRIINVSSAFHYRAMGRPGDIHFDDLFFERSRYDGWTAYAQSKLANLLHAKELATRLVGTGVTAVSVHPGWVRTALMRHSIPIWLQNWVLRPALSLIGQLEPWEGAQATLHAALSPDVPQHSGAYFSQAGPPGDKTVNGGGFPFRSPNPNAHDDVKAAQLYEASLRLVGRSAVSPA